MHTLGSVGLSLFSRAHRPRRYRSGQCVRMLVGDKRSSCMSEKNICDLALSLYNRIYDTYTYDI